MANHGKLWIEFLQSPDRWHWSGYEEKSPMAAHSLPMEQWLHRGKVHSWCNRAVLPNLDCKVVVLVQQYTVTNLPGYRICIHISGQSICTSELSHFVCTGRPVMSSVQNICVIHVFHLWVRMLSFLNLGDYQHSCLSSSMSIRSYPFHHDADSLAPSLTVRIIARYCINPIEI